jgi:hypothetical protein
MHMQPQKCSLGRGHDRVKAIMIGWFGQHQLKIAPFVQAVRSTGMNEESSRSHLLVYIFLQSTDTDGNQVYSKLCLADLAGTKAEHLWLQFLVIGRPADARDGSSSLPFQCHTCGG